MATNRTSLSNIASKFEIIPWNPGGSGNRRKRSHLSLFLSSLGSQPAVLALQESGPAPSLPGYCSYVGGTTTCLLVHKAYTAIQIDLDLDLPYDYSMMSVLSQRRGQPSIHILNVYCPPRLARASFAHLFHRALRIAARQSLVIVGDFNAPSPHWGYHYKKARGRELKELISSLSLTLLTDPAQPTRSGNSVTRDTCPDLSLTRHIRDVTWENLGENLGSDHFLLRISFTPRQKMRQHWGQARLTDWTHTEECKLVCHRTGIMAGGEVKALGTMDELKDKFAKGCTISFRVLEKVTAYVVTAVDKCVKHLFPGARQEECREGVFLYYTDYRLPWSHVFSRINKLRHWFKLESVLVSESSLDEILLGMARAEQAEDAAEAKQAAKDASHEPHATDPWGREEQNKYERRQRVRQKRRLRDSRYTLTQGGTSDGSHEGGGGMVHL
ncbi:hypothetical protein HPB50_003750 [Hyalomma asiaticum]|uniref:Uncharacterized protein n=1 Tax=Hyalomma asiaticum TaxID=266040 RepID=A0ACB7SE62_HYAAI|nr:hypothetical protein HPB50_003750 [Hyalomma asiaticum]